MSIDRRRAHDAFAAYVAPYDPSNRRIALKIDHTYRVAGLCDRIARSLGMGTDEVDLAWLCGLLHDIGRFEQVRRWDTFRDAASTSHALLGCEVLFGPRERLGVPVDTAGTEPVARIRDFLDDDAEDGLVRTAIAVHSDFRIPEGLDERTRTFANVLRDADKIDILRTIQAESPEVIIGCDEQALLKSPLSDEATRAFDARRCMLREERRVPADYLVGFACFAFELAYPKSREIMRSQGYLTALLERPFGIEGQFRDPHTRSELARMAALLETWL